MDLKPIRNEDDYENALRIVSPIFDNPPKFGTEEGDKFEVMLTLIEAYEAKHYPISAPDDEFDLVLTLAEKITGIIQEEISINTSNIETYETKRINALKNNISSVQSALVLSEATMSALLKSTNEFFQIPNLPTPIYSYFKKTNLAKKKTSKHK